MRKTTTTLVAVGALTAFGLALAPTAMAAMPTGIAPTASVASSKSADATDTKEHGDREHGPRDVIRRGLETVMSVLDLSADELRAAREAGTTLAELAQQQGVESSTLIDALLADAEEHLADRVADGHITQDQADTRLSRIEQRVTDRVMGVKPADGERPERGEHGSGEHGQGEHGSGEHGQGEHGSGEHGPHGPQSPAGEES